MANGAFGQLQTAGLFPDDHPAIRRLKAELDQEKAASDESAHIATHERDLEAARERLEKVERNLFAAQKGLEQRRAKVEDVEKALQERKDH